MVPVGYTLLAMGVTISLYGQVRFLAVAYRRSIWWLLGCLFIPLADWVFMLLNFKATRKAFALSLLGLVVAGLGAWLAGVVWPD